MKRGFWILVGAGLAAGAYVAVSRYAREHIPAGAFDAAATAQAAGRDAQSLAQTFLDEYRAARAEREAELVERLSRRAEPGADAWAGRPRDPSA